MPAPFAFLKCLGKALVKHIGNAVGFGVAGDVLVDAGEDAWKDWNKDKNEAQKLAEFQAIARAAGDVCRQQVEAIVREVAAGRPDEVRQLVQDYLNQVPGLIRRTLQRPDNPGGQAVLPNLSLRSAADLWPFLSGQKPSGASLIMAAKVTLTVQAGQLDREQYVFTERTTCIIGRDDDCDPQVPNTPDYKYISRLHCMLDINPPDVRIRDFGSLHGTFLNGAKIGQREHEEQRGQAIFPEHDLKDSDEIRLGDPKAGQTVAFRVGICVPAVPVGPARKPPRLCVKCGRDVAREAGANRPGDFVCKTCQAEPDQLVNRLLELARSGKKELLAIRGYEIQRELGRGGMGAVYLARHEQSREQVALKVMLPQVAAEENATRKFLGEIEYTRALKHRHVVQLRDAGCSDGVFFFTLEYCDGGSVDGLMAKQGLLAIAEAGNLILQVLAGLDHAHHADLTVTLADGSTARTHGVVHRDLKPQNIFLSGSGGARVAKVGDYGLAKAFDAAGLSGQTRSGSSMGTPYFMPRQQVVNFKYAKPEVDVWAAAASLYFMLTGQAPRDFPEGKDPWTVVLQTAAVPIRQRQPALPAELARVIDDALVDKPRIHFKTAAEFKRALESVL